MLTQNRVAAAGDGVSSLGRSVVIVSGAIANKLFNGGAAWTRLNYVLGLQKLGCDVYFVEQIQRETCVDETGRTADFHNSANLSYFRRITEQFGLASRAVLICGEEVYGAAWGDLLERAEASMVLINISGHLNLQPLMQRIPVKAYIDLDPGFTQFWHACAKSPRLEGHDYYFTVGENIGETSCCIPTNGIAWHPTRQPVVLEHWPVCREGNPNRFTTVASWRGPYGPIETGGRKLGSKVHSFRKYAAVPLQMAQQFEIALDIHNGDWRDRDLLRQNSWNLVDPREVAGEPCAFRRYIQTSGAEFSVAQQIYVETGSGWFSDRSVRYLASGKPVVVEDTGLRGRYEAGEGLLTFSNPEQAVAGVNGIARNYTAHVRAARQIAEAYFDSDKVLSELLDHMNLCV
jgi:hypothetical protein